MDYVLSQMLSSSLVLRWGKPFCKTWRMQISFWLLRSSYFPYMLLGTSQLCLLPCSACSSMLLWLRNNEMGACVFIHSISRSFSKKQCLAHSCPEPCRILLTISLLPDLVLLFTRTTWTLIPSCPAPPQPPTHL